MSEERTEERATEEGTEQPAETVAEPSQVVAEGGEQEVESTVDLSTLPQFQKYDANMQRRVAEATRRAEAAEQAVRNVQEEARKEASLAQMRSSLEADGLDEERIKQIVGPLEQELISTRLRNEYLETVFKSGLSQEELAQVDKGSSREEFEVNITSFKAQKALKEAERLKAEALKEAERIKAEVQEMAKTKELENRKVSGADRLAGGQPEPTPDEATQLRQEYDAAIARCTTRPEMLRIRQNFRIRGLDI